MVTRAYSETVSAAHVDTSDVYVYRQYEIYRAVGGTDAAAHNLGTEVMDRLVPQNIVEACAILVARWSKRADTAWADRTGTLGEGMLYYQSMPAEVKQLLDPYRFVEFGCA
jgi:hypothetical protein